jgi:hypothetical protein
MTARGLLGRDSRVAAAVMLLVAVVAAGCGGPSAVAPTSPKATADSAPRAAGRAAGDKLVAGAISALARLDDFDEARAYEQAFDRLNQWSHLPAAAAPGWQPDPLVDTLRPPLRAAAGGLDRTGFDAGDDVIAIRDRRWLADIADSVRGDAADDLDVARRLFDWTIRSLALVSDPPAVPSADVPGTRWFMPGEVLLAGRASSAQRSWIFVELLRQAGIDAVLLATGDAAAGTLRPWVPAVLVGGEAYLFEPTYGLPVPGPGGEGVATLRQAGEDPAILAGLSVPERAYPVKAADIAGLSVLVAADPWSLSRRMNALDRVCASRHGLRLAVDARGIGRRAATALGREDVHVGLWEFPWETAVRRRGDPAVEQALRRELAPLFAAVPDVTGGDRPTTRFVRPLFTARVREFRGDLDGPDGAKASYLASRPSRGVIQRVVQSVPQEQAAAVERVFRQMKEDATYWLGLVTLAEGENEAAVDYLARMTLDAAPDSRWTDAARANLGRALAALGRTEEAVKVLREDGSPQRFGSQIRADRLEKSAADR